MVFVAVLLLLIVIVEAVAALVGCEILIKAASTCRWGCAATATTSTNRSSEDRRETLTWKRHCDTCSSDDGQMMLLIRLVLVHLDLII